MSCPEDERLLQAIWEARDDHEFMDRLRQRIEEDAELLAHMAQHQHRYPPSNSAGFSPNQCLDCGEWIIAAPDLTPPPSTPEGEG